MFKGTKGTSNNFLTLIRNEASSCQFRIDETEKSIVERKKLSSAIETHQNNIKIIQGTTELLKLSRKETQTYVNKKKEKSMSAIYSAIYSSKSILPDTTEISLLLEKEEANLVNNYGDDVNRVEGSAFRAVLSFFMRAVLAKNSPFLKVLLLDEPLTTLSPDTSALLSEYLPYIAKDLQVVLIEQKSEIFHSMNGSPVYDFKKSEGKTVVRKGVM